MNKKRRHRTPIVQVVELGPDFWCDHCGLLSWKDFSDFTEAGIEQGFKRAQLQFQDQYGHGLS